MSIDLVLRSGNTIYYYHKTFSDRRKAITDIKQRLPGVKYHYVRAINPKTKKETYHFYLNKKVD